MPSLGLHLATAGAMFLMVALRAFQQLNVMHDQRMLVMPTSLAMAACEAVVIVNNAKVGLHLSLILATGIGAGLGCLLSMSLHKRLRHKESD